MSVSPTMGKWVAIPYASRAADWDALTDEARQFVSPVRRLTLVASPQPRWARLSQESSSTLE